MSLVSDIQLAHALAAKESALSSYSYLKHVIINSDPEPRRFADLAEPWQWARADYILPAVEYVTGLNPGYIGPHNIWETMPRGHDKTSFIGRMMNWVLCFSKRKNLRLVVAAKDSEQAGLIKDFMRMEADLNPWFGNLLTFHQKNIFGPAGKLTVASADAKGLFGHNIDLFIIEELTHWENALGQEVWTALWSGRRKRQSSIFIVISNAGYYDPDEDVDTWQHKIFLQAKTSQDWKVYEAPGMIAGWMNREQIEEDRRLLPPAEATRLIDNQWVILGEDQGYLTRAEVNACVALADSRGVVWTEQLDPSKEYILSIDYGPKKDRTAIAIGHQDAAGMLQVDRFWLWEGKDTLEGEVPISRIRKLIESLRKEAPSIWLVLDPYQLKELAQDYRNSLPVEECEARGGKMNYEMAETLRTQVINRNILWPKGIAEVRLPTGETEGIVEELTRLILRPMTYGYRFDHKAGRHDDRACALGMMCVAAFRRPRPAMWVQRRMDSILKQKTPDPYRNRGSGGRVMYGTKV